MHLAELLSVPMICPVNINNYFCSGVPGIRGLGSRWVHGTTAKQRQRGLVAMSAGHRPVFSRDRSMSAGLERMCWGAVLSSPTSSFRSVYYRLSEVWCSQAIYIIDFPPVFPEHILHARQYFTHFTTARSVGVGVFFKLNKLDVSVMAGTRQSGARPHAGRHCTVLQTHQAHALSSRILGLDLRALVCLPGLLRSTGESQQSRMHTGIQYIWDRLFPNPRFYGSESKVTRG